MKKQFYSFLLLLSFAVSVSAQAVQPARIDARETALKKHIEYLASDKLEGRRTGEPGANAAAKYISDEFGKIKLKRPVSLPNAKLSYLQPFSYTPVRDPHATAPESGTGNTKAAFNVIGILEGRDKVLKNEAIVIGAHYDHLGRGGAGSLAANSTDIHHGADDNASGTAAIIELARQFAKEKNNKRTLIFIAFSGEEDGLFGSKYYVDNPVFPLEKTIAMINLDMVGRLNENKLTIGGIGTATEWKGLLEGLTLKPSVNAEDKKIIEKISSALRTKGFDAIYVDSENGRITLKGSAPAKRYAEAIKTVSEMQGVIAFENQVRKQESREYIFDFTLQLNDDGFGPSDHSSFYGKRIPVLFFFTGTHLDYHKPTDTAEKINYGGELKIIDYVAAITKAIDTNPQRPTYTVAKSANTGGRMGFSVSLGTIPTYAESTDGMLLDGVRENSPASRAGLKAGDKLVKLAGKDVKNVYDYTAILGELKPDVEYEVVVLRGGETLTLKITPVKR